jgi:SNF2 family DNA or RNA helicase
MNYKRIPELFNQREFKQLFDGRMYQQVVTSQPQKKFLLIRYNFPSQLKLSFFGLHIAEDSSQPPYQVKISRNFTTGGLCLSCSCLQGQKNKNCAHLAALGITILDGALNRDKKIAKLGNGVQKSNGFPKDKSKIIHWLHEHLSIVPAATPLSQLTWFHQKQNFSSLTLANEFKTLSHLNLGQALMVLQPAQPPTPTPFFVHSLEDQLEGEAEEWLDHRLYEEEAKLWRKAPESPIELALWQAAYQIINRPIKIEDIANHGYITHELSWGILSVTEPDNAATPPLLHVKYNRYPDQKDDAFEPLDIKGKPNLSKYSIEKQRIYAGLILDQLFHPAFPAEDRKRLFEAYQQQPWERSIAQMLKQPFFHHQSQNVVEEVEQNVPESIGFQFKRNANSQKIDLSLVALKPYQRKEGFKIRVLENSDIPPKSMTAQEMAVHLFSQMPSKPEHLLCALELLIGSPYVVSPQGEQIKIKRAYPHLYLGPVLQGEIENDPQQDLFTLEDTQEQEQEQDEGDHASNASATSDNFGVDEVDLASNTDDFPSFDDDVQMLLSSANAIQTQIERANQVFSQSDGFIDLDIESQDASQTDEIEDQASKKRRGRPPKNKQETETVQPTETILSQDAILPSIQKRRGRPPKNKPLLNIPQMVPLQSEELYVVQFLVDQYICQSQSLISATLKNEVLYAYFPSEQPLEICIFRLPELLSSTIKHLLEQPLEIPAKECNHVISLIEKLESYLPVRLPTSLKGQQVEPDLRPLLRCMPSQNGSSEVLSIQVLSRVLQQGPCYLPGEGPSEVAIYHQGLRIYTKRPIYQEMQQFDQLLKDLPLNMPVDDYKYELTKLQEVLELIDALQTHAQSFQVEWQKTPHKIRNTALSNARLKIAIAQKKNILEIEGHWETDGENIPLDKVLNAVKNGDKFIEIAPDEYARISDFARKQLEPLAYLYANDQSTIKAMPLEALQVYYSLEGLGAKIDCAPKILELQNKVKKAAETTIPVPDTLNANLRPYQEKGFEWMAKTAIWSPGVCLADDMGLGKTIQTLALLLHRAHLGPTLIVSPVSVAQNWIAEAQKFAPTLNVKEYRGSERKSKLALSANDVLVTSYSLLGRDISILEQIHFATAIYDEAQTIKNPDSIRTKAALKVRADYSVALSGTPIENHLSDLYSIAKVITPGLFSSESKFKESFIKPMTGDDEFRFKQAQNNLMTLIKPFVLRRMKSELKDELPNKQIVNQMIELSIEEKLYYDNVRKSAIAYFNKEEENLRLGTDVEPLEEGKKRFFLLACLTRLRQLACAVSLVFPETKNKVPSTKLNRLVEMMIQVKESGGKALVFSQFVQLLGLAKEMLKEKGFSVCVLDGTMSTAQRQKEVDYFQDGKADVFLISLKSGGTGLNLTKANYVFHLDPWWNPATEDQANDRAYRIGQTEPVTIYRLISNGTIENHVVDLNQEKRKLADALIGDVRLAQTLSQDQLLSLLKGGGL